MDLTRTSFRVLLPLAFVAAVVMVLGGVVQNFWSTDVTNQASGFSQTIPGGPVASQEAIKMLGTNGGGYFNANSAHPFENPNAFISLFEVFLILLIPSALPYAYGRMVGDQKQGYTVVAVMGTLWLASIVADGLGRRCRPGNRDGGRRRPGEGFEQRFGPGPSAIFATSTTLTSTGAVNVAHDSLPPLAGGVAMVNMMLGEVAPGGTGSGLYGLLILSIISVFIAGLMVGRTPEYLGKKIGPTEMKLAAMYILVTPTLVLALSGITVLLPDIMANAPATGPHQFSEVLYAFTSGANNNGSAFGGITTSGPYLSVMMGLAHAAGPLPPDRPGARPGRLPRPSGQGSRLRRHRPHPRPAVRLAAARRDSDHDRPELLPGPCPRPPRRRTPQMTRSHTALATDTDAQTYADGNPLGTPGEHKHHTKAPAKLTLASVIAALPLAVRKLSPRQMIHSPVMFTVLVGAALCTAISPVPALGVRHRRHRLAVAHRPLRHPVRIHRRGPGQSPGRQPPRQPQRRPGPAPPARRHHPGRPRHGAAAQ